MWGSLLAAAHSSPECRGQVWGYMARGSCSSSCKGLQGGQGQPDVGWQLFCYHQFFHAPFIFAEVCLCVLQGEEL